MFYFVSLNHCLVTIFTCTRILTWLLFILFLKLCVATLIYVKKWSKISKISNQMTSIQVFLLFTIWARTICFLHSWIGTWSRNKISYQILGSHFSALFQLDIYRSIRVNVFTNSWWNVEATFKILMKLGKQ